MLLIIVLLQILTNSIVNCEIGASADLNCDFASKCRWRNATDDNGEWMIGSSLEIDPSTKITPMKNNDGDSFAYSTGFMGRTIAMLVSEVVNCQLGGGNIQYWYYQTGEQSQLEVCMRQPPGNRDPNALRCYDGASSTRAHQWVYRIVELPPASQPFEIILRATYFPPTDVIAIDDIIYNAALCEIANEGSNAGAGGTFDDYITQPPQLIDFSNDREVPFNGKFDEIKNPQEMPTSGYRAAGITSFDPSNQAMSFAAPSKEVPAKPDPVPRSGPLFNPMCPLIDCNFDDNTFCNYITSQSRNVTESLREWAISARGILNSNTGIPKDLTGSFAYAGGLIVSPEETFVMSSNLAIEIKEKAQLDFFVYQAGIRGRLRVCLNNLNDCPLEILGKNIDNNARKWKNYVVPVDSGTHAARPKQFQRFITNFQIHFVADKLYDNYVIGIDNIQLLNMHSTAALKCT